MQVHSLPLLPTSCLAINFAPTSKSVLTSRSAFLLLPVPQPFTYSETLRPPASPHPSSSALQTHQFYSPSCTSAPPEVLQPLLLHWGSHRAILVTRGEAVRKGIGTPHWSLVTPSFLLFLSEQCWGELCLSYAPLVAVTQAVGQAANQSGFSPRHG